MLQEKIDPREALAGKLVGYSTRTDAKPARQVTSKVGGKQEGSVGD